MLQYKRGNLLDATEDIIAHGCNCIGAFGAGLGGGDWNKISQIIEEEMSRYHPQLKVTVYEL